MRIDPIKSILRIIFKKYYSFQFSIVLGLVSVWMNGSLILLPSLVAFLLLVCLVQVWYNGFWLNLIIFYFGIFCGYLLEAFSLLIRNRKWVDPGRKGGEKELGGETETRIYCMRKQPIFNKRGKCLTCWMPSINDIKATLEHII